MAFKSDKIIIRGARVHNLKDINVEIPRHKLVVITGLSGSGKSSLAFDTIFAESQRRYVESLSNYARQFLGVMEKPDVDKIEGLPPAIAIDQRSASTNPRSTVGTMTEIYDYLRLLFARAGEPRCPYCQQTLRAQKIAEIKKEVAALAARDEILFLAPVNLSQADQIKATLAEIDNAGYAEARLNDKIYPLSEILREDFDPAIKYSLEIVVARYQTQFKGDQLSVDYLVNLTLDLGNGLMVVYNSRTKKEHFFSRIFFCQKCQFSLAKLEPRLFSFNSTSGACPSCKGLGTKQVFDPDLLIPNRRLTLPEGAVRPWLKVFANQKEYWDIFARAADEFGFALETALEKLNSQQLAGILYGAGPVQESCPTVSRGFTNGSFAGVIPLLTAKYQSSTSEYIKKEIEAYMRLSPCPDCQGQRLNSLALGVTFQGFNIAELGELSLVKLGQFFKKAGAAIKSAETQKIIRPIIKEIILRLKFLEQVGLGYLTLGRQAATLAGGEAQRIRIANQITTSLVGVVYVLDEPSIGLHPRDNVRLLKSLKELRDLGNTVLVVEHDEATMIEADWLIDVGPGAGEYGGKIVACGTPAQIKKNKNSLTGQYLTGDLKISEPIKYRAGNGRSLVIKKAAAFNLKNIEVEIPLGRLVCITGVSGSGKSTLLTEILVKALNRKFYRTKDLPGKHEAILGLEHINKVIAIDQSPIGRTPRSNPATYTGVFNYIRDLFVATPEAKIRGYRPGHFSFNVREGRCGACRGEGLVRIEMQFLSDVYVSCQECKGKRYNVEALEINYGGKNIAEVLEMTVEKALAFFAESTNSMITEKLKILKNVGLDYIRLGQPATTLSGGEAQRVKLATELSRRATGKTMYILDEPTTGLHFADVARLLGVLNKLVDKGNTVLIVEHNLEVIKSADWIIDLGPKGGDQGGELVAVGTPREVALVKKSYTGQYLKKILK